MFSRRYVGLLLVILLAAGSALGQGQQGRIVAAVTDSTGAAIVGANLTLVDQATGATKTAVSGSDGKFVFLALQNGNYKLTVSMQGFRTAVYRDIKVDLGQTANVATVLQVGGVTSEVVVEAAAEVLQTTTSTLEGSVQGRQLRTLPLVNRDVLDFVLLMPGAQQAGQTRQSTFDGLPKSLLNITMDGINVQDNAYKTSDSYFTLIRPKQDAVEEISVTTGVNTADNAASGAVQIKFATRRGTNDWHGGLFEFFRDQGLNANTFFNNRQKLPRQRNHLHQYGGSIGGPLVKNKLFVFNNFEDWRLPQSFPRSSSILTPAAMTGDYYYLTGTGTAHVNLLTLAAANGLPSTINPLVAQELAQINQIRDSSKVVSPVTITDNPSSPWYQTASWNSSGGSRRFFNTTRIDYDVNDRVRWNVIGQWNHFQSDPDLLNGMDPSFPLIAGISTPDANTMHGGQNGERYSIVTALNWTVTPRLNYELRVGKVSGISHFNDGMSTQKIFPLGYGFRFPPVASGGLALPSLYGYVNSTSYAGLPNPRDSPIITIANNFGWAVGRHSFSFGAQLDLVKYWQESFPNRGLPTISLGCPGGCGTGADGPVSSVNSIFNASNLPNASDSSAYTTAMALYATLVGEVSSADYSYNLSAWTKQFSGGVPYEDLLKQREIGAYFADSFRPAKTLTLNYGLRWEYQGAAYNPNNTYVELGLANGPTADAVWGISGRGNLFKPGTLTGGTPQYYQQSTGIYNASKGFAPSFGLAWSPNVENKLWHAVFGGAGKTVFRGGYSIAFGREGLFAQQGNIFNQPQNGQQRSLSAGQDFLNGTVGRLMLTDFNPATGNFSSGGNVVPYYTFPAAFTFPMKFTDLSFKGAYVNAIDPNIKLPYVQSWSFGIQRELSSSMVVEARYQGNHGTKLWRDFDLNEVNIFENGFFDEFKAAKNNLAIFRAANPLCGQSGQVACNFGNTGLQGQVALPIMETAFGSATSSTFRNSTWIGYLNDNTPGTMAYNMYPGAGSSAQTRYCNLVGSSLTACTRAPFSKTTPGKYPANFWVVNPDADGGSFLLTNAGDSFYDAFTVELRRRMSKGLMIQGNYTFSKSISNIYASSPNDYAGFRSLRNTRLDRGLSPFDLTHVARIFWNWELPFGPGRRFGTSNKVLGKITEGWEFSGIAALQSGRVFRLNSPGRTNGNGTVNQNDGGVKLNGITLQQLQSMVGVNKNLASYPAGCGQDPGFVYFLSTALVGPDCRAYHWNSTSYTDGPIQAWNTAGQWGSIIYLHGPRFIKPDLTIGKATKVSERTSVKFEARFFNALNIANFFVSGISGPTASCSTSSTNTIGHGCLNQPLYGRTSVYYQDINGNQDPGPRMIEFVMRLNF